MLPFIIAIIHVMYSCTYAICYSVFVMKKLILKMRPLNVNKHFQVNYIRLSWVALYIGWYKFEFEEKRWNKTRFEKAVLESPNSYVFKNLKEEDSSIWPLASLNIQIVIGYQLQIGLLLRGTLLSTRPFPRVRIKLPWINHGTCREFCFIDMGCLRFRCIDVSHSRWRADRH